MVVREVLVVASETEAAGILYPQAGTEERWRGWPWASFLSFQDPSHMTYPRLNLPS